MLNELLRLKQLHHTWIVNMAISSAAYKVLVNKYFIQISVQWEHSTFIKCKFIWSWKMYLICFLFRISTNGSFLKEFTPQLNFQYDFLPSVTTRSMLHNSGSQSVVCRLAASASPGKLLETSIPRLQPRLNWIRHSGVGPRNLRLSSPSRDADAAQAWEPLLHGAEAELQVRFRCLSPRLCAGLVGPPTFAPWNDLGCFTNTGACVPPRDHDLISLGYGLGLGRFKKFPGDSKLQTYLVNTRIEAATLQPKCGRKNSLWCYREGLSAS